MTSETTPAQAGQPAAAQFSANQSSAGQSSAGQSLAGKSIAKPLAAKGGERRELISFRIGTQDFCVDIMAVREIRGWTPATPLPHAPGYIRGVINLRGAVLPIVDLSARFGLGMTEPTARHVIIVTNIGERVVGLQVDAVSDILTATEDLVQPTPDVASDMAKTFIRGILAMGERMLSLISLDRVLPQAEADAA